MKTISFEMNGKSLEVPQGTTLLKAAESIGVHIPRLCYHEACTSNALCRLCVVEVSGSRLLQPACIIQAADGMQVKTETERVMRSRRTLLELLASSVDISEAPELLEYIERFQANPDRFPEARKRQGDFFDDNPMYVRDYSKCVLCWRCVQVCAEDAQYTYAINFNGRGYDTQIGTFFNLSMPESTCVFCGQCVGVCPSGALKPKRQWQMEQDNP